jgi:hypothetical protein
LSGGAAQVLRLPKRRSKPRRDTAEILGSRQEPGGLQFPDVEADEVIHVLFLFPRSVESGTLDDFISGTFVPGLKQARGAGSVNVSAGDVMSPGGQPPYSRVVEVAFDSLNDVIAAVEAPEAQAGRQTVRDLGALILTYEVNEP